MLSDSHVFVPEEELVLDSRFTAAEQVASLLRGHAVTQIVASAVRLGVIDHTYERKISADELSQLTGIPLDVLSRYMRVLQSLGLVAEVAPGEYEGTPLAEPLTQDEGGLRGHALMCGGGYYQAWAHLDHALTNNSSAFEQAHGRSLWEHLEDQPDTSAAFVRTMRWNSDRMLGQILSTYEFPESGLLVDLGGGDGTLLAGILARNSALRGIVLERPAVVPNAQERIKQLGVADRCDVREGDLLAGTFPVADMYILKSVIHNWDDQAALKILGHCRDAMNNASKLVLIERGGDPADDLGSALRDLTMLTLFGSRDRTAKECVGLLEEAGFVSIRSFSGASGLFALEAMKS